MANTLKFGNGEWAVKKGSTLAYNSENGNFKPLPFTFDRSTSATRVNKEGLIEVVPNNEPRIDFLNDSNGALLLEPNRSNKVSTSNDFNGSGWNISNLTVTANQIISPDGTLNASKLEMTGNGALRNQSEASFSNGYSYSIFVKKGNSRYVTIRSAFFTQSFKCGFDLDTLTAQTNGKIEDYGNDWYRLSITKDISGDVDKSGFFYIYLPNSLGSQTSVSGNYVYAYGGQIEEGSYPTSYIPTQGSIGTRVAESCVQTVPDGIINSSEGVFYAELSQVNETNLDRDISISDSTNDNVIRIKYSTSNSLSATIRLGGVNILTGNPPTTNTGFYKVAVIWSSGRQKVFINGIEVASETNASTFATSTLTDLKLQYPQFGIQKFNGKVKDLRVYNQALTDAELIALTS